MIFNQKRKPFKTNKQIKHVKETIIDFPVAFSKFKLNGKCWQ